MKTSIEYSDIIQLSEFEKIRKEKKQEILAIKKNRRIHVGPYSTFYFENYQTIWWQIHEMLRIEKGDQEQIQDELQAYNPMIPNGQELTATVMFEIDNESKRNIFLNTIGGIENHILIKFDEQTIFAKAEQDLERTSKQGKASSVHFIHFVFTSKQIDQFNKSSKIMLGFDHPNYQHITVLNDFIKEQLMKDFLN